MRRYLLVRLAGGYPSVRTAPLMRYTTNTTVDWFVITAGGLLLSINVVRTVAMWI